MKKYFLLLSLFSITALLITSCKKDKPAKLVEGSYSGSFEGKYSGNDTLISSGYAVTVSVINDNKIKVEGNDFEAFEVLVATNGINVEPVSQSDPYLKQFIYIGDKKQLKFTFNKGVNEAEFIGAK